MKKECNSFLVLRKTGGKRKTKSTRHFKVNCGAFMLTNTKQTWEAKVKVTIYL